MIFVFYCVVVTGMALLNLAQPDSLLPDSSLIKKHIGQQLTDTNRETLSGAAHKILKAKIRDLETLGNDEVKKTLVNSVKLAKDPIDVFFVVCQHPKLMLPPGVYLRDNTMEDMSHILLLRCLKEKWFRDSYLRIAFWSQRAVSERGFHSGPRDVRTLFGYIAKNLRKSGREWTAARDLYFLSIILGFTEEQEFPTDKGQFVAYAQSLERFWDSGRIKDSPFIRNVVFDANERSYEFDLIDIANPIAELDCMFPTIQKFLISK